MTLKHVSAIQCDGILPHGPCPNLVRVDGLDDAAVAKLAKAWGFVEMPDGRWLCMTCRLLEQEEKKEARP